MSESIKTRIKLLYDTEANYTVVANKLIPLAGEVCVVSTTNWGLRTKIGDGLHNFGALPYTDEDNKIVRVGYYLNNKFYTDSTYQNSVEIPPCETNVYIDKNQGKRIFYLCDGTNYIRVSPEQATSEISGVMKLYSTSGQNTDGTMTQKSITDGVNAIKFAVASGDAECLVLDLPWN